MKAILLLFLAALMTGCAQHSVERRGDLTQFIIGTAAKRGARFVTTNGLPVITATWRVLPSGGSEGVGIWTSQKHYYQIEALLRTAFGEPDFARGSRTPQITAVGTVGWYGEAQAGVFVRYFNTYAGTNTSAGVLIDEPRYPWVRQQ